MIQPATRNDRKATRRKKSQLINKREYFRHFTALSAMPNFMLAVLVQVDATGAHSKH